MSATTNANEIRVRSASSAGNDAEFIVAAWDSTLPYLASIGAGEMWGDQPFSEREGHEQEITDMIRESEEDDRNDKRRLLVAEVETSVDDDTVNIVQVGAAMIRDTLPGYLTGNQDLKSEMEKARSCLFIEVIISDHRSQNRYRGVGPALIEAIKRRAIEQGKDAVYVDIWAGNERKLNRYYENLGLGNAGEFSLIRGNGSTWRGTLYCIDLTTSNVSPTKTEG